ncbi:MAG: hypothetical protein WCO12_00300 [bacterium]
MGLFSSNRCTKNIELVCDVGSGSVGISLVDTTCTPPKILFCERIYFTTPRLNATSEISVVSNELKEALVLALQHAISQGIKPSHVSCFYSSPWFISQVQVLKLSHSSPSVFSEEVFEKLVTEGENNFMSSKDASNHTSLEDVKIIERRVTQVKLNGYQTHNPFGKKSTTAEVSIFVSALSKKSIETIEESINHVFAGLKIEHHTFVLASGAILRNLFHSNDSFFVFDISDEVTDISLIDNNALFDTMSFPIGTRSIISRIESDCKLDYSLAQSALSMYLKNETHEEQNTLIDSSVDSIRKDWFTQLERSFGGLVKNVAMPPVIYFITDENMIPFFETLFEKNKSYSQTMSEYKFQIIPIKNEMFESHVDFSNPAKKDFFLGLEALYLCMLSPVKDNIVTSGYVVE